MKRTFRTTVFVLFAVALLAGCSAQRRLMIRQTQPYCDVAELVDEDTGMQTTFTWTAVCEDGRRFRCGGRSGFGSFADVHCEPEADPSAAPAAAIAAPASVPAINPCDGVACSGHGRCIAAGGAPVCACEAGYVPDAAQVNCLSQ